MKRVHLFEFEDLQWFPKTIRNYLTDFLQFVANLFDFYAGIIPVLKKGIEKSPNNTIIDLASGGGGAWLKTAQHLKDIPDLKIILTDFYPNTEAFKNTINKGGNVFAYSEDKVNALNVPNDLIGLRTMFLSFHHFKPDEAISILQNAVDSKLPIAIFEGQERNLSHFIKFLFSPINVLLVTPFIRPFKFTRILFTYFIPIVPIFVFWDGIVSVLRTYSVKEMEAMIKKAKNNENYHWEVAKTIHRQITILYLLGFPKKVNISD